MKKIVVVALFAFSASYSFAAPEAAVTDGNVSNTSVLSVDITTGSARASESRRATANDLGELLTIEGRSETIISTGNSSAGAYAVGNTTSTFAVNSTSWTGTTGCRGLNDNCNVARLASVASPIFLKRLIVGDVAGGGLSNPGRTRIRIYDSQGSTDPVRLVFFGNFSSNTAVDLAGITCSSGVAVFKDSVAEFNLIVGKQAR